MAESSQGAEEIANRLQNVDFDPPKSNIHTGKKSGNNDMSDKHTDEKSENVGAESEERHAAGTEDTAAIKLKSNLVQKSKNLSAEDKAKIAEMVRGLAKFKLAEEDIEPRKEGKTNKRKKEKKIETPVNVAVETIEDKDVWEDIESDEGLPGKSHVSDDIDIHIHVGDKRTVTQKPKPGKMQSASKVGSYTQLLQTVGGRKPAIGTGSSLSMKPGAEAKAVESHHKPSSFATQMSSKKKTSSSLAESYQKSMQQQFVEESERQNEGTQQGDQVSDSGSMKVKLSHKEQAKLRSETHKLTLLDTFVETAENVVTQKSTEKEEETVKIKSGVFKSSQAAEGPTVACSASNSSVEGQGVKIKGESTKGNEKQTGKEREKKNKKKEKKEKKQKEKMLTNTQATKERGVPQTRSPVPLGPEPVTVPGPAAPAEVTRSPNTSEVRIRVPKEDHRYIVGLKQKNLKEIYNLTGVTIEVPRINDNSEEVVIRGDKFQIGPAITLMYTKCEVSRAESEHFIQEREMLRSQMTQDQEIGQAIKGQGKQGSGSGQGQPGQKQKCGSVAQRLSSSVGPGEKPGQFQSQGQHQRPGQGSAGQPHRGQGQRKNQQGQVLQNERPRSGQGQGKQNQRGASQAQGQGQNKEQSQNKTGQKKKVFEPYWSSAALSQGLKRGTLIEGPIRINPKNYEEAYVPHPDGKSDIYICSYTDRNRALNGDIVAVLLKPEGDWKLHTGTLQSLEDEHKALLPGGENPVEGGNSEDVNEADVTIESEEIIELDNLSKTGETNLEDSGATKSSEDGSVRDSATSKNRTPKETSKGGNKNTLAAQNAQRFTSLSDVLTEGSPVAKRLFGHGGQTVKQAHRDLLIRTGKVVAIIERKHCRAFIGKIKPFMDNNPARALFVPNDCRQPRMMIPLADCPKGLKERPEDFVSTLFVGRLTEWRDNSKMAFGKLARSLGEAGEIEPETEGMLIENGVDFDEFPQQAIDCLPTDLPWRIPESEFEYRRDFRDSCIFTIDPSTARDLDDALSCEDLGNGKFKVGVHIADVSWFIEEGSVLDRVASLRATSVYLVHKVIPMLPRLLCEELCSLNPDEDRLAFSVEWTISESGEIEDEWFGRSVIRSCTKLSYDHAQGFIEHPEREWTEEELPPISEKFSVSDIKTRVLNLHKIAKNLRKGRFDGGCLRLDQPKLSYSLDAETGLPNGYWVYQQKESNSLVEEFMLLANMAVAHRINSFYPDKALLRRHPPPQEKMLDNLKEYCQALGLHLDTTGAGQLQRSLWRYCDDDEYSMARMQVLVSLCAKPMQNAKYFCTGCIDDESLYRHYALNVPLYTHFTSPIRRYPDVIVHRLLGATLDYCDEPGKSPQELHKMAEHCNDKKTAAKRCSDLSSELFFAVFIKVAGPLEEKAMVMAVFNKAFDIFVLRLGVTKRVYCDKLDIKDKQFTEDKKVGRLTLVWNTEDGEPELKQVIQIFSAVDCVLQPGELPLQWMAVIKRPAKTDFLPQIETSNQEDLMADDDEIPDTEDMTEEITEQSGVQIDNQQETETMIYEETECVEGLVAMGVATADEENIAIEEEFKNENTDKIQADGQAAKCDIVGAQQENLDKEEFVHTEIEGQDKTKGQAEGQGQTEGESENPDET